MADVASPLQHGDPPRLGPFLVQARLHTTPAGLVYLGQGPDGRAVSLALLTRGAAFDATARDRFVTAMREAVPERSGVRGWMTRASRNRTALLEGAPQVLAMDTGPAPWVATPFVPGSPGAERFLEPVMVSGMLIGEVHGPDFVPYWLTDRAPALPAPPRPRPPLTETVRRVLIAAAVLAALLLTGLVILLLLFAGGEEVQPPPRPLPRTGFEPSAPPIPASPDPGLSPTPTPGDSGSDGPRPSDGEGNGEDDRL
jgi:hypothetical protein